MAAGATVTFLGTPATTWFPVLTLLLGACLKAAFDWLGDRRMSARERAARLDQRRDARAARRTEFQRETLLALQEAIILLGRLTGQAHYQTLMAHREGAGWGNLPVTEEVSVGYTDALNLTTKLRARTADEEARQLAQLFQNECTSTVFAVSEASAEAGRQRLVKVQDELHERIGLLIRQLDEEA